MPNRHRGSRVSVGGSEPLGLALIVVSPIGPCSVWSECVSVGFRCNTGCLCAREVLVVRGVGAGSSRDTWATVGSWPVFVRFSKVCYPSSLFPSSFLYLFS